jgi:hypothetical protein
MRHTVNYRSTLVMAATLGGSALAPSAPARACAEHYWTGAEQPVYRRAVAESSQQPRTWTAVRPGHKPRLE